MSDHNSKVTAAACISVLVPKQMANIFSWPDTRSGI